MNVRISHCSTSVTNYQLCLKEKVSGFSKAGPHSGDLVYLVVKIGQNSMCGARFTLHERTEKKPWANPDKYSNTWSIKNIEYCKQFDVSILAKVGGTYWGMKYLLGAKIIKDKAAIDILDSEFLKNRI
jgi:hypothetical protein